MAELADALDSGSSESNFMEVQVLLPAPSIRNPNPLESYSKGQFCKNTVYLERGMPYFVFVSTNSVLVRKNRQTFGDKK